MYMKRKNKKAVVMLVSLVLLVCVTVGSTLALLIDQSGPLKNIFNPSEVNTQIYEEGMGTAEKVNVKIRNTGDTDAYIRAAVVVTFKNSEGHISPVKPEAGTHYNIDMNQTNWFNINNDGIWYHKGAVTAKTGKTAVLINKVTPGNTAAPEGYFLNVEIIASGIQSDPIDAAKEVWGDEAAAWVSTPASNG